MADNDDTPSGMDYAEHEKSYGIFYGLAKWSAIIVTVVLILMAIFLV